MFAVLFFDFNLLAFLSFVLAGSFISNDECPSEYYHCRLKCNADEHAIRHCADFSICCKLKIIEIDGQKKW
uniref:Beta-defensin n=1 Tax=Pan troglodytes TaxID=9598 RepID=H2RII7_PANTR